MNGEDGDQVGSTALKLTDEERARGFAVAEQYALVGSKHSEPYLHPVDAKLLGRLAISEKARADAAEATAQVRLRHLEKAHERCARANERADLAERQLADAKDAVDRR